MALTCVLIFSEAIRACNWGYVKSGSVFLSIKMLFYRSSKRDKTRRLLVLVYVCMGFYGGLLPNTYAKEAPSQFQIHEFRLPATNFKTIHYPFWIEPEKLGFVTRRKTPQGSDGSLIIYDLQTRALQNLLNREVDYPAFLAKLNRISFVDNGKSGIATLFTMSRTGKDIVEHHFVDSAVFDPSWDPDNRRVVFTNLSYDANLLIAEVKTGKVTSLGNLGRGTETEGVEGPDWSVNGTEIAYVGWDKSSRTKEDAYIPMVSRLYKFRLREHKYARLTPGRFQDRYPAYSPDGKRIAFISNRSQKFELWLIDSDGQNMHKLTNMASLRYELQPEKPAWSPDGRTIIFTVTAAKQVRTEESQFEETKLWVLEFR